MRVKIWESWHSVDGVKHEFSRRYQIPDDLPTYAAAVAAFEAALSAIARDVAPDTPVERDTREVEE